MKSHEVDLFLRLELDNWFNMAVNDPYTPYYLYYLPTSPEHNGGFLICQDKPANSDYELARPEKISGFKTVDQNYYELLITVGRLPILEP